jgi:hypothetical protein
MSFATKAVAIGALFCVCNIGSRAEERGKTDPAESGKEMGVTIEVTQFEVTDSWLALTFKIRNSSDHAVWVCSSVRSGGSAPYELYLMHDKQTLLLRKRLDVPCQKSWRTPPDPATYVRLEPGTAQAESLLLGLPITPTFIYATVDAPGVAQPVRRLALQIGYYDEDLPALVRGIFSIAGEFKQTSSSLDPNMERTYFRGLAVRRNLRTYDLLNPDPYSKGRVRIDYSYQALAGEKVLAVEINGVAIPYQGHAEGASVMLPGAQ